MTCLDIAGARCQTNTFDMKVAEISAKSSTQLKDTSQKSEKTDLSKSQNANC